MINKGGLDSYSNFLVMNFKGVISHLGFRPLKARLCAAWLEQAQPTTATLIRHVRL